MLHSLDLDQLPQAAVPLELAGHWKVFQDFLHGQVPGVPQPNFAHGAGLELVPAALAEQVSIVALGEEESLEICQKLGYIRRSIHEALYNWPRQK